MPNWEFANYDVTDTPDNIAMLDAAFDAAKEIESESDFGPTWLGNLMLKIGYKYDDVCHRTNGCPNARGSITDRWAVGDTLTVQTETAWEPLDECMVEFIRYFCPDASIYRSQMVEYTEEL